MIFLVFTKSDNEADAFKDLINAMVSNGNNCVTDTRNARHMQTSATNYGYKLLLSLNEVYKNETKTVFTTMRNT